MGEVIIKGGRAVGLWEKWEVGSGNDIDFKIICNDHSFLHFAITRWGRTSISSLLSFAKAIKF